MSQTNHVCGTLSSNICVMQAARAQNVAVRLCIYRDSAAQCECRYTNCKKVDRPRQPHSTTATQTFEMFIKLIFAVNNIVRVYFLSTHSNIRVEIKTKNTMFVEANTKAFAIHGPEYCLWGQQRSPFGTISKGTKENVSKAFRGYEIDKQKFFS